MNFKRDTDSQDADGVKFRTMFFGKLNSDPDFYKQAGKKLDELLRNGFERPETNETANGRL